MTFRKDPSEQAEVLSEQASGIGALADPLRRELYEFICDQADSVGREAVAEALDIPLHTARSQLDRLVKDGLLEVEFRRLNGKSGPGAGRPSKLYRRSDREFAVSLPVRNYDLVGHILATVVDGADESTASLSDAMDEVSYREGLKIGEQINATGRDDLEKVSQALGLLGYEPRRNGDTLSLVNCPFDALAKQHTALVCGLNLSYVKGVCEAIQVANCESVLEPEPDHCCVKIRLNPA